MKVSIAYHYYGQKEIEIDDKFNILKHREVLSPEEEMDLDCELMDIVDEYLTDEEEVDSIIDIEEELFLYDS